MAKKPCKIKVDKKDGSKPKTYSYSEFMNMLYNGGLNEFVQDGLVNTRMIKGEYPFGSREPRLAPAGKPEIKERGWITNLRNNPLVPKQFKEALTADGTIYESLPNSVTVAEANAILDAMGEDAALSDIVSMDGLKMPFAYRMAMSQILMKRLNQMGRFGDAVRVAEATAQVATDLGQGIQALSLFKLLTPEGQLLAAQRDINKIRQQKISESRSTIDKVVKELEKAQRQAAREVAEKFSGKNQPAPSIPPKPSTPKSYGSKNKVVNRDAYEAAREALLGKLKNEGQQYTEGEEAYDEIFTIAQFHYEAVEGDKAKFVDAIRADLGEKAAQYADSLYNAAKSEVETVKKNQRIDELFEKLNSMMAPPPVSETEGEVQKRKTKEEKMREIAAELDQLTETTDYTAMVDKYAQAKEVQKLTDAIDRMTEDKEPETRERKTKEEKLREAATRLDEINGGTFYSDYVEDYIKQKKVNDLSDKLDNMMQDPIPSAPQQRVSKDEKMRQMAAEVDALNGNSDYSEMVEEYIKEKEIAAMEKRFNQAITIKPPKPRSSQTSRQKKINQMALDLQAKTGDSSYVAAAMAFEKAKRDQAEARKAEAKRQANIRKAVTERGIISGLTAMGTNMGEVIRSHYEAANATKERLIERLIDETGLTGRAATDLANKISEEFDRIATERKKKALDNQIRSKDPVAKKSAIDKMIELHNLGAMDRAAVEQQFADAMGFPKALSQEEAKQLNDLANKVQEATSEREKNRALFELMKAREKIKGLSKADMVQSLWMASILSGPKTQAANIIANNLNILFEYLVSVSRRPDSAITVTKGLLEGLRVGFFEGLDTWRTGQAPIRGKVEIPSVLENVDFIGGKLNPANYAKYVRRFMMAADTFSYEGLKQMRSHQLAYMKAINEQDKYSYRKTKLRANELLGRDRVDVAKMQAETERVQKEKEYAESLRNGEITRKQHDELVKMAKYDERFRVQEIIEENRDDEMRAAAHKFAAKGTFNHEPEGSLGVIARGLNNILGELPLGRYAVPFVNVITNVTNNTINYSPVGFLRAASKRGAAIPSTPLNKWMSGNARELSDDERTDLYIKAAWGTALSTLVAYLAFDDEEEPTIEVTSKGYGSFKKNAGMKEELGWQEDSFRVKIPGTNQYTPWISYRYTPMYFMMKMIGGAADQKKYQRVEPGSTDMDRYWEYAAAGLGQGATSIFEGTFLNSTEDFLSIIHEAEFGGDMTNKLANWFAQKGTGVIPNLYQQSAQIYQDWMDIPDKEVRDTMLGRALRYIPIARNDYENKVGILGDDIPPDSDLILSYNKPSEGDDIMKMLVDRKVSIPATSRSQEFYDLNGEHREMTENEYYNYSKIRGHFIKWFMLRSSSDPNKPGASNLEIFKNMTEEEFDSAFDNLLSISSQVAKTFCDTEAKIPKDTENYWNYIVKNFPEVKIPIFKMVPDKFHSYPEALDVVLNEVDIRMKSELYPVKEMAKDTLQSAYRQIEKESYVVDEEKDIQDAMSRTGKSRDEVKKMLGK